MVGLSFICNFAGNTESWKSRHANALESTVYNNDCYTKTLLDDDKYILSCTKYDQYPIDIFENETFWICLEGKIYSTPKDLLAEHLYELASRLYDNKENETEILKKWLLDTDGEFVIFIRHKPSGEIMIFNDIFCHLPLYCYNNNERIIISRDYHFVSSLLDEKKFDKMGIAQYLLFSFFLDSRTHLQQVKHLPPSTLIRIEPRNSLFSRKTVHTFNFEVKKNKFKTAKKNAQELVPLFIEACKNRVDSDAQVLISLSGGLDSRTVASGLSRANVDYKAVSFLDYRKSNQLDVDVAEMVSKELNIEWQKYDLEYSCGKDALKTLKIKGGLLTVGKAKIVQFMELFKEKYGSNVIFFSGNGGDGTARCIIPDRKQRPRNLEELIEYILKGGPNATGFSIKDVAALTQLSEEEIIGELKKIFTTYPEKNISQKYVHFDVYGQLFRWHHEGNDRKRQFFWAPSPFWSVKVFTHLMNCPDYQKKNKYLYTKFISMLSDEVSNVPYANNNAKVSTSISKNKYALWQFLALRPRPIRRLIRKFKQKPSTAVHKHDHSPDMICCMTEQINNCDTIKTCLSKSAVNEVLKNAQNYRSYAIGAFFTIISALEYIATDSSTIEKYAKSNMEAH
jgi:asparagine synthase (glutamine-hydrolysing)